MLWGRLSGADPQTTLVALRLGLEEALIYLRHI